MIVGFTGTQAGMTAIQRRVFREQLIALTPWWFFHGDCIGADAQAHSIAMDLCRVACVPA